MSLKQEKPLGALDPAVVLPPPGCKIYDGHPRYEPKWCSGSLRANDHEKKKGITRPHPDGRVTRFNIVSVTV